MEPKEIKHRISELLEKWFIQDDYNSYFLVGVQITKQKLSVFIDGDEGVSFGVCKKTSRYLESFLDEEKWLGENYTIEVSSPGADKPLKNPRQFNKHVGRKADVLLDDEEKVQGKIKEVKDGILVMETSKSEREIKFENIIEMKIIVSF